MVIISSDIKAGNEPVSYTAVCITCLFLDMMGKNNLVLKEIQFLYPFTTDWKNNNHFLKPCILSNISTISYWNGGLTCEILEKEYKLT